MNFLGEWYLISPDALAIMMCRGIPSDWIIDIWNCHGVVKPRTFAGYGNQSDEILKYLEEETGEKYVWFDVGYYTVPVQERKLRVIREAGLEEEFARRTEKVCDWIVYDRNGGAINISGFYTITYNELVALEKVVQRILTRVTKRMRGLHFLDVEEEESIREYLTSLGSGVE